MASIQLKKVKKIYPNGFQAIHGVDLDIKDGEFLVFVGPSGCAKSTLLRMIAGLESISDGEILIDGRCVNDELPKERGIAMVFQNYALYPHMSVYKNMAFSLRGNFTKEEIEKRVLDAAEKLELTQLLDRKPSQLSGGQCQRVALGRAIVRSPEVFLFDEPLSNLDAKLRVTMRLQLIELHNDLKKSGKNATMIYVTHDQVEAMTMGDRICVLNQGQIMQVDKPTELYHFPANKFVAEFIGSPPMNLWDAKIKGNELLIQKEVSITSNERLMGIIHNYQEEQVTFGIRPEDIKVLNFDRDLLTSPNHFTAKIKTIERMGNEDLLHCQIGNVVVLTRVATSLEWEPQLEEEIILVFDLDKVHLFDIKTEKNLGINK
ncbi:ABC transporter ATP-binding protein [Thorsellia kenyensis]|uniref:ABC transporter ATP-binding protein n=1 Tax=Thorsellia kenyensis TaxID=1549888 RepID=A0ABV6CC33_9GAMM